MNARIPLVFLAITFALTASLRASPLEKDISQVAKSVQQEIDARQKAAGTSNQANPYLNDSSFSEDELLYRITHPGNEDPQIIVIRMLAPYTSDGVREAKKKLLDDMDNEHRALENIYIDTVHDVVKRASNLIFHTEKPSDYDQVIADLSNIETQHKFGNSPEVQSAAEEAHAADIFFSHWQEYLSAISTGQTEQAKNILRELYTNAASSTFIPRSQLLSRLAALISLRSGNATPTGENDDTSSEAENILDNIDTLDEMPAALEKIRKLSSDSRENPPTRLLRQYIEIYEGIKAGLPVSFTMVDTSSDPLIGASLKAKMLLFLLQNYFSIKSPLPGESTTAFIVRVLTEAGEKGDWDLYRKALVAKDYFERRLTASPNSPAMSLVATDPVMSGLNQEAAGQYQLAVLSYQSALRSPSNYVPAKIIGERLANIAANHPREYEAALQQVLPTPRPTLSIDNGKSPPPPDSSRIFTVTPVPSTSASQNLDIILPSPDDSTNHHAENAPSTDTTPSPLIEVGPPPPPGLK